VDGRPAPDRNDEYLFYQTLAGTWPLQPAWPQAAGELVPRLQAYMLKAAKEAKVNTSWINPNQPYDEAVQRFVEGVLDPSPGNRFLADFVAFHGPVARLGMVNSLAQTAIKVTAPGVPDFYQGTELWDFSLVDPDNRRPVDYETRIRLLDDLRRRIAAGELASLAAELTREWPDGRIKLYTAHRALVFRRSLPDLFQAGAYLPLAAEGPAAASLCAFARRRGGAAAVTVVPRLTARLTGGGARLPLGPETWGETLLELPADGPARYTDLFTGRVLEAARHAKRMTLAVADILAICPVALLVAPAAGGTGNPT
jgi:(1->4)-alpha-D-glucan 1-alpha-D-glucosylmutase